MGDKSSINIWINEERDEMLRQAGLSHLAKEALAGMKVLQLYCTEEQKDKILKRYPTAKYDSATTKSIELLPPKAKDKMFDLVIEKKTIEVIDEFLNSIVN
ncbi:hypothetical protein ES705_07486 [subsurface metagenome]|jgi:hypothetical protein|nr:hypothetical protein [Clostridia bacterium]RXG62487.1 MAG: hypothetical protein ES695_21890 [Candidatus Atribacteria bacterium 1244-E10-H5-B2]